MSTLRPAIPAIIVAIMILPGSMFRPAPIDPFLTTPDWTAQSGITNLSFGPSYASAGDVNGDGYSDVIIGAPDRGGDSLGRAFVFHGSATGLSTTPDWIGLSDRHYTYFGFSVASAGDVNGDGFSDVIVGAPEYEVGQSYEGKAYVYYGSADGLSDTADWELESNSADAYFGWSVSTAGDVNGDGYSDIIIGAREYTNDQSYEGRAFVFHGSASGLSTTPDWYAESNQSASYFGYSVASAGDVNGDGYSDVIVGAPHFDNTQTDEGRAFVYLGSDTGLSDTSSWTAESDQDGAYFGWCVASCGDVDADGYSDVVIGAPYHDNGEADEGRISVYRGLSSGLNNSDSWTMESNVANAKMGYFVSSAGDVDGNGCADVIAGASDLGNGQVYEGKVFVYRGNVGSMTEAWTKESDIAWRSLGECVASAGDVNGDGYSDVLIADNPGTAYVYHGFASGLSFDEYGAVELNQAGAKVGSSVSTAGDVNGDGYADVIVGAPYYSGGESYEGRAEVYHGMERELGSLGWHAESDQIGGAFGYSVSTAGDVNGDGYADVIVGAPSYGNGESGEGRAYVYLGSGSGLSSSDDWYAESNQIDAHFGVSVSTAGDVTGDGYSDVIVGAPDFDNGQTNEGRVWVYCGSATGLADTAAWIAEVDTADVGLGISVCTAGDVNGDGFSDIIVGASDGRVRVYHGSATGLSPDPDWYAESGQASSSFGISVAAAGDVNGDGYSDVIVGAKDYDNTETDEGRAFVYLGSALGLSDSPAWTAEPDQSSAGFGASVATAGDINGDGYSDVIVGAPYCDNGQTDEGLVFVYLGSSTGLSDTPIETMEFNQAGAQYGASVAPAGDVGGEGFSDVVIGSPMWDWPETDEGAVFVLYGNSAPSPAVTPRQWRADLTAPVFPGLKTRSTSTVGLGLTGRTFFGRSDVKVQYEVKPLGTAFDGTGLVETSSWSDVGVYGDSIGLSISGLSDRTMYKWRARTKYRLTEAIQPFGRWIYHSGNGGLGEADFQVSADNVPLPVELVLCAVSVVGDAVELRWTTVSEVNSYGFEVERKVVSGHVPAYAGIGVTGQQPETRNKELVTQWSKIGFVKGSGTSSSPRDYSFDDRSLSPGRYAYRIKQIDNDGSFSYTAALELEIGLVPRELTLAQNYPNPFNPKTMLEFTLADDGPAALRVFDLLGKELATLVNEDLKAGVLHRVEFDASRLASGPYFFRLDTKNGSLTRTMLVVK